MLNGLDKLIGHFDAALRTCAGSVGSTNRSAPIARSNSDKNTGTKTTLSTEERLSSARLMRVNHCGEVCAQALYHGQALTAKSSKVKASMKLAADEETDHLSWCESRLKSLDNRVSYLNPVWYSASFFMGAMTGLLGDKINLGFVAATEDGVCEHLDEHIEKLPAKDIESKAILTQMRADEEKHMNMALDAGGAKFPKPILGAMKGVSKLMTRTTYWV